MTMMPLFSSKPSICTSSSFSVIFIAAWSLSFLLPPRASISSMNMMLGDFCLAASNSSRTRFAPRPTYTSSNCDPDEKKKGTPASPAMALARRVLPVPGGPVSSSPLGSFPPSLVNLSGSLRYSTISSSSAFASFTPLTSSNRTSVPSASCMCFPDPMAPMPPRPRPCSASTTVSADTTTNATRTCRARDRSMWPVRTGLWVWTKRGDDGDAPLADPPRRPPTGERCDPGGDAAPPPLSPARTRPALAASSGLPGLAPPPPSSAEPPPRRPASASTARGLAPPLLSRSANPLRPNRPACPVLWRASRYARPQDSSAANSG
mmetsp:Transcript_6310/g.14562  ORF Transcript_6310/g.14562 Transcript_6310/m.14562 type:complete len:320 (-) Transcript_6310:434-1393(-)